MTEGIYFFYYHDISDEKYVPNNIRTSPGRFEAELQYITTHFKIIHIQNALTQIKESLTTKRKPKNYQAVICFDDAFRSVKLNSLKCLKRYKTPFTVFANSDFVLQNSVSEALLTETLTSTLTTHALHELFRDFDPNTNFRSYIKKNSSIKQFDQLNKLVGQELLEKQPYLSVTELSELPPELTTIGNHTSRHLFMSNLSLHEQRKEIDSSHDILKNIPQYNSIIALPFGCNDSYNQNTITLMNELNNQFLIKANGGINHTLSEEDQIFTIERIGLNNNKMPIKKHIKNRTAHNTFIRKVRMRITSKFTGTTH